MDTYYYTTREVADMFKVTPYTVTTWIRNGKLKATRIGHKLWRISEDNLKDYLSEQGPSSDAHSNKAP